MNAFIENELKIVCVYACYSGCWCAIARVSCARMTIADDIITLFIIFYNIYYILFAHCFLLFETCQWYIRNTSTQFSIRRIEFVRWQQFRTYILGIELIFNCNCCELYLLYSVVLLIIIIDQMWSIGTSGISFDQFDISYLSSVARRKSSVKGRARKNE